MGAMRTAAVLVGTTPTKLTTYPDDNRSDFDTVICNESAVLVRVGGVDVAFTGATRGIPVPAGASVGLRVEGDLYGICATGTADCTVGSMGVA